MYYAQIFGILNEDFAETNQQSSNIKMKYITGQDKEVFYITLYLSGDVKEIAKKYTKEGTEIYVSGKITKSKKESNGKQYINELMFVDHMQVLKNGKFEQLDEQSSEKKLSSNPQEKNQEISKKKIIDSKYDF